ncbi:hypothetical protein JZ751_026946 [Albula glossodonta]|uniref:Uncharacterized protein n=1 Tax=Albula glossodonta TaxID=121402 RepID=A0A8T2NEI1_9TELE|nr:hypothetical protein JZ751_026946 [Albula glossodonta]
MLYCVPVALVTYETSLPHLRSHLVFWAKKERRKRKYYPNDKPDRRKEIGQDLSYAKKESYYSTREESGRKACIRQPFTAQFSSHFCFIAENEKKRGGRTAVRKTDSDRVRHNMNPEYHVDSSADSLTS